MNHVKIFKGQTRGFALWVLGAHWYKTSLSDHIDLAEMKSQLG